MRNILSLMVSVILFFVFLQILGPLIAIVLVVMLVVWLLNVWRNAGPSNKEDSNQTYTTNKTQSDDVIDVEYTERRIHDDSERN